MTMRMWSEPRSELHIGVELDHKTKLNNKFYAYLSILVAQLEPDPNLSDVYKNYTVDNSNGIVFDTIILWWLTHEIPNHQSHQDAHSNKFVLLYLFKIAAHIICLLLAHVFVNMKCPKFLDN